MKMFTSKKFAKIFGAAALAAVMLAALCGCQSRDSADTDSTESASPAMRQNGDFTVFGDVLIGYTGTDTEPVIPAGISAIGARAFESSPAADSITKITLGPDVDKIDNKAFFGLPSLCRVDVGEGNSAFIEYEVGYTSGVSNHFICAANEQQVFYFQHDANDGVDIENAVALSGSLLYSYKEKTDIAFICDNAVLDIYGDGEPDSRLWYCRAAEYEGNTVTFDEPVDFAGGNCATCIFETASHELVFGIEYYYSDIYYITKDASAELHPDDVPGHAVIFYRGDDGELRYRKIKSEFCYLSQSGGAEAFYTITSRDEYYGEDGRVDFANGEFNLDADNVYTISDHFKAEGTDIDTLFETFNDGGYFSEHFNSLDDLFEYNKKQ